MTRLKKIIPWCTLFSFLIMSMPIFATAATPITFWTTEMGADRQAVIKYLTDAFMIFNPDIEIHVEDIEENAMVDALTQAQKEGTGPNIISCASNLVVSFSELGWINNTGTEACISNIGKDRFYSGTLSKLQHTDGTYSGIPLSGWVQGIWYRKDWFKKHGLNPPNTWNNILKAAKTFHAPEKEQYGILIGTQDDVYTEQIFTHLALSAGVKEFTPEGKVVFDTPATVETLKFYAELTRYTPPGPQSWRGRDFYLQGQLAMMFYSTFIMDDMAIPSIAANSLTGDNFEELCGAPYDYNLLRNTGFVSSITGTHKASYGTITALGLMKTENTAQQQAAERLVEFLFSNDAYITWLHMVPGGTMPVLKDIAIHDTFFRDHQGVFQKYSRQRVQSILSGFDSLKSFSFVDGHIVPQAALASAMGLLSNMITRTLQGKVSPEEAVSQTATKMRMINSKI
nr:ABC transporter substrate-binding protein [uncultured Pseudodesulfovibrio sp.]